MYKIVKVVCFDLLYFKKVVSNTEKVFGHNFRLTETLKLLSVLFSQFIKTDFIQIMEKFEINKNII
jgi:hypothetical protein